MSAKEIGRASNRHVSGAHVSRRAFLAATAGAALLAATIAVPASAATSTPRVAPCVALTSGIQARFLVANDSHGTLALSGLVLSNLDETLCDGQPVTVSFSGNADGDPNAPANLPLAILDSTQNPCTGAQLPNPVVITAGMITLHACPTVNDPTKAAFINVHDVTLMTVQVDGQIIDVNPVNPTGPSSSPTGPTSSSTGPSSSTNAPSTSVLGETFTNSGGGTSGGSHASVLATVTQLPFTGTYAALIFWLGVLLVVGGLLSILLAQRRRWTTESGETPRGGRHS